MKKFLLALAMAFTFVGLLTVSPSSALDFYWVGESGLWNDTLNWSLTPGGTGGAGVPGGGDRIFITQSDGMDRVIEGGGIGGGGLIVDATGTGTITLLDFRGTYFGVRIGQDEPTVAPSVIVNQTGALDSMESTIAIKNTLYNMSSDMDGGHQISISDSTFNQTDGALHAFYSVNITNTTYNLSGGSIDAAVDGLSITGGTFNQTGGIVSALYADGGMSISGTYNLSGTGVINAGNFFNPGGTFNQKGGEVYGGDHRTTISGTYNLEGGSLTLAAPENFNKGNFNYTGGSLRIAAPYSFTNNGVTTLSGTGTRVVDRNVGTNGTWKVTNTTAVYAGTFTNNGAFISDSSLNMFTDLIIGEGGHMQGDWEDLWYVCGKLQGLNIEGGVVTNIFGSEGMYVFYSPFVAENSYLDGMEYNLTGGGMLVPTTTPKCPKLVEIDIKPDSYPNDINLKSKEVVPVAILTTTDFDASSVDPSTVVFAGAKKPRWTQEDLNNDGYIDLLLHFDTKKLDLAEESTVAVLTGMTLDGTDILGMDTVNIVPKEKKEKK